MAAATLGLPLLIILAGALLPALLSLPLLKRRLAISQLGWLSSLAPLVAFVLLASRLSVINAGPALSWRWEWIPSLGLSLGLYLDNLSALFGLLVTGIGTLVVIYSGYYFRESTSTSASPKDWRFLSYLLLFMFTMLGLVMAGDVITLFVFWEATSITSFLLIAYKYKEEAARHGAFKSLFITGGGGVALLAGLLMLSYVSGSGDFTTILSSGELLRESPLYPVMLGLVALGAFTKSAQFPAHIWLPEAMSAPTPASAYLHSATMVKAGIYLMARLNPTLGFTDLWFWLLSLFGLTTMLTGAYLGLKQNDLKALLAYSTISQLGVLMMLIGQDTSVAFKALVIGVLAHALYKSALFLLVGIVDHETGTRDLRRLGGLGQAMPLSLAISSIAALSMAGLPPLFGFLAKETLLATATHPALPHVVDILFPAAVVAAGALVIAQAGMLIWDTFLGTMRDTNLHPHEAPRFMLLAPAIPALLSLAIGLLPEPEPLAKFLANTASLAYGDYVKVSLALWTGITVPLVLSIVAVSLGMFLFVFRHQVRAMQMQISPGLTFNALYTATLGLIDRGAYLATRLQGGQLRIYLAIILSGMLLLILWFAGPTGWDAPLVLSLPALDFSGEIAVLRVFALLVVVAVAAATVVLERDFSAIVALGASGLAIAVLIALEPAPDVALVQVVVDILAMVILVLALARLPRPQRHRAQALTFQQNRLSLVRDALIAAASAVVVTYITLIGLMSRPRESLVTPFYEANAKALTGARDIVGAIVVDFRALDTLIETAVFSLAGLGVYTLLCYASKKAGAGGNQAGEPRPLMSSLSHTLGIGGGQTSPFVHALAYASLPLTAVVAVVHMMYGHDQPGDGFTAGVIISLALGFWYVVFGYYEVKRRLAWIRPVPLIGGGILLVILSATTAALVNGSFFSPVDFGKLMGLPLPTGFNLSTSFLFEVAICLAVLGSASHMLDTLGHPGDSDEQV